MTPALACGLALALASALALDAGFLLQQAAAAARARALAAPPARGSARALLASRRWFAGFGSASAAGACYFAALSLAPLSLVQTVAASSIGLLVVLAALARHALPLRRERIGAIARDDRPDGARGSAGRSAAAPGRAPRRRSRCSRSAPAALRRRGLALRRRSAALGGLAAGLCYGVGDVTSKAMLRRAAPPPHGRRTAASPLLYATAGAHGAGFVARSSARSSTAAPSPRSAR